MQAALKDGGAALIIALAAITLIGIGSKVYPMLLGTQRKLRYYEGQCNNAEERMKKAKKGSSEYEKAKDIYWDNVTKRAKLSVQWLTKRA